MIEMLFTLVACHLIGDYVLQSDFIANTKGLSWYHLFVHCVLYTVPFYLAFGLCWQLAVLFVVHIIVDQLKARYNVIPYSIDQILHYAVTLVYFIGRC